MSTLPDILFPLFQELTVLDGVGPRVSANFGAVEIYRPRDLIFTLPHNGVERLRVASVLNVDLPQTLTLEVKVVEHNPPRLKSRPYRVFVRDEKTIFALVFFHARKEYLSKILPLGERRIVSGKVELFDGVVQMVHPDHVTSVNQETEIDTFEPIYPLTAGVTQKTMTRAVRAALGFAPKLPEWIDPLHKERSGWPDWRIALSEAHDPQSINDMAPSTKARVRLAYDEFFAHQLTLGLARDKLRRSKGISTLGDGQLRNTVMSQLPYALTEAQDRAVHEIIVDMSQDHRMNRLLQGDVGSGKTLVAFLAVLNAVESGGQGVLMAPTEILARQHLESLRPLAMAAGVEIDILTGRDKGMERKAKLSRLFSGNIQILIGTHAVFQKDVAFCDLRLAIVDEQHRFGVRQRLELGQKGQAVDVLVMTATPIPRSLALAQYGDMDVSILNEKPAGRKPVKTAMVSNDRLDEVIAHLLNAVEEGQQAYWVCPLVEESEVLDYTSAEDRFKALRALIGEGAVDLVHGQMPPADKDIAMARFETGETKILVATTVIEVGVNVPNASIIVFRRTNKWQI